MTQEDEVGRRTTRQQMMRLLALRECTALELSAALRIREKEVYEHLGHVQRSVAAQHGRFHVRAAECLECHYIFADRRRLTTPGRCPRCRGEHIQDPKYRVETLVPAVLEEQEQ